MPRINKRRSEKPIGLAVQSFTERSLKSVLTDLRNSHTCQRERKKKSGAVWKAEEDEELNKSRAFVELTEYTANAVENDTYFFILAELQIKLYSLHTKAHTLQCHYSVSLTSSSGATIYN